MRDIIRMDDVQPVVIRLILQIVSIFWLVGCVGYTVQVLWRL